LEVGKFSAYLLRASNPYLVILVKTIGDVKEKLPFSENLVGEETKN
jgi:hypothetical protein